MGNSQVETQVIDMSQEDFDVAFDITSDNHIKPDDILGGVKEEKNTTTGDKKDGKSEVSKDDKDTLDLSTLDDAFTLEGDEEKTDEEVTESNEGKSEKKEETSIDDEQDFFKAKVDHLIEKGVFFDFEGREDFEYTEENFLQLSELQAEWKADQKYKDKTDALGNYKIILDHIEEGGNPEDIIEILKESKDLESLDTSSVKGKIEYLKHYYIEELGWSQSKFDRNVKIWAEENVINEEFEDTQKIMKDILQKKVEEKRNAHKEYLRQQEELRENFQNSIEEVLQDDSDLSSKDKRELKEALFEHNMSLGDGRKVNRFTYEFLKIQANPKDYINLVKAVIFKDKVEKIKEQKIVTETNKKIWNKIKNNASVTSKRASSNSENKTSVKDLVIKI